MTSFSILSAFITMVLMFECIEASLYSWFLRISMQSSKAIAHVYMYCALRVGTEPRKV